MLVRTLAVLGLSLCAACAASQPAVSPSGAAPTPRPAAAAPGAALPPTAAPTAAPRAAEGFETWREGFRPRARAAGVSDATFDAAFAGVAPNARVLELDRRQPEFSRPIWEYLDSAVSDTRIATGREERRARAADLARIEAAYGVPAETVLAIWGLESAYGANYGSIPVVESLATLAWDGRRRDFAEEQLIEALRIIQAGDITAPRMVGSWAGAMGHTQFIPTSFAAYAVDFDGDGRRDLWRDDAVDALASTANYLARFGWETGAPWGLEARLPAGFDFALADGRRRPLAFWAARGVTTLDGAPLPQHGEAAVIAPAGARGPAFAVYDNFFVILRYNNATSYALAVGHLSDRIAGAGPFRQGWPRGDRTLSRTEKEELQRLLTRLGYDTNGADGVVGPDTRAAIRRWQADRGLPADGYDSADLLAAVRREGGA